VYQFQREISGTDVPKDSNPSGYYWGIHFATVPGVAGGENFNRSSIGFSASAFRSLKPIGLSAQMAAIQE
jgi:hypothetical protein